MKKTEPLASPYSQTSIQFIKKVRSIHTRNSVRGEKYSKGIKTNPRIQGEKKRDDKYEESFHPYNEGRRRERERWRSVLSGEKMFNGGDEARFRSGRHNSKRCRFHICQIRLFNSIRLSEKAN